MAALAITLSAIGYQNITATREYVVAELAQETLKIFISGFFLISTRDNLTNKEKSGGEKFENGVLLILIYFIYVLTGALVDLELSLLESITKEGMAVLLLIIGSIGVIYFIYVFQNELMEICKWIRDLIISGARSIIKSLHNLKSK